MHQGSKPDGHDSTRAEAWGNAREPDGGTPGCNVTLLCMRQIDYSECVRVAPI